MRTVFADANYWIGLFNPKDQLHTAAILASRGLLKTRLVTSEMVLVEVLNGLGKFPTLRTKVAAAIDAIVADPNTEVVPQTSILFRDALALFRQHQDKEWGLTDCSSFVIMRQRGLTEALTFDRHFEQAEFRALLREYAGE
jgi:predicted nucleic acid-binding protein